MDYFGKSVREITGTDNCFAQFEVYGDWSNPSTGEYSYRWTSHLHIPKKWYNRPLNEVFEELIKPTEEEQWIYEGGNADYPVVLQIKMGPKDRPHMFEMGPNGKTKVGWGHMS